MHSPRTYPRSSVTFLTLVLGSALRAEASQQLPVWKLSDQPMVAIGVVEGDPNYELADAGSSVRMDGGTIVVADAGSRELRFFDGSGKFLRKAGRRGSGPGEFRWLLRVYRHGPDSVLAYDHGANRLSVFSLDGAFARTASPDSVGGDRDFPMDVWLRGRFWVEGALEPDRRRAAGETLARLPSPDDELGYRFARVDDQGNIWVREPLSEGGESYGWTVFSPQGEAIATIRTPLRYDVQQIGSTFVLGRWRDENDVNFIRLYRLERTQAVERPPAWIAAGPEPEGRRATPTPNAEARSEVFAALRAMVTAQERYYADHGRYSQDRHALEWSPPEDLHVDIVAAHSTGWAAVATHRRLAVVCGMGVGGATPPGWPEGAPKCG